MKYIFVFLHCYLLTLGFHLQVGGSVRGSVRPPVWLRPVLFCNAGGPWPRLPGHPGQLPYLWERHHVVEHERQHSVHTAQGSCAVRPLYTARWGTLTVLSEDLFWNRIASCCLWELEEVVVRITCGSKLGFEHCLHWLGRYWSLFSLLSLCLSPSAILLVELVYAVVGIAWLVQYYQPCSDVTAKNLALGEPKRI